MEENKEEVYVGFINQYYKGKHYGFVEKADGERYFFYIQTDKKILGNKKPQRFAEGDDVSFQLKDSEKEPGRIEAYNLTFLGNERRERLVNRATAGEPLFGYLKQTEDTFYVKDKDTKVYVPLMIMDWEINLDEVYTQRINQLVAYQIIKFKNIHKLLAVLSDAQYDEMYHVLKSVQQTQTILQATVTGNSGDGVFATILYGRVYGFIRKATLMDDEQLLILDGLQKKDKVKVRIGYVAKTRMVSLLLAENASP